MYRAAPIACQVVRVTLRHIHRVSVLLTIFGICCYQCVIRPFLIGSCKFCPSCSNYAIEALQRHGLRHGLWLALRRLLRCHPFSPGGFDPVPDSSRRVGVVGPGSPQITGHTVR